MPVTSITVDVPVIIISLKIFIRRFFIQQTEGLKEEGSSL